MQTLCVTGWITARYLSAVRARMLYVEAIIAVFNMNSLIQNRHTNWSQALFCLSIIILKSGIDIIIEAVKSAQLWLIINLLVACKHNKKYIVCYVRRNRIGLVGSLERCQRYLVIVLQLYTKFNHKLNSSDLHLHTYGSSETVMKQWRARPAIL